MKIKLFFFFLLFTFNLLLVSTATVRYVSKTGTSTPPYTSWATASDSIQKCINICQNGDTVYVANGVYKETLIVNKEIALIGSSMDSTVIDGQELMDGVQIKVNSDLKIENVKLISNYNQNVCISVNEGNLTANNLRIENYSSGVLLKNLSSSISNVLIYNCNRALENYLDSDNSNSTLTDCIVFNNNITSWSYDRLLLSHYGSIKIHRCMIIDDITSFSGVTIYYLKSIDIKNTLISGYHEDASIRNQSDLSKVENSIFSNTNGSYTGTGGLHIGTGANLVVRNNILCYNRFGLVGITGPFDVEYSLFWKNQLNYFNFSPAGVNDIRTDPMFIYDTIPRTDNEYDYHLQKYSPAIDAGDPNILDIDGSRSDIGMFGGPLGQVYTYHDLAPKPPRNLTASVQGKAVSLKWNKNTEADVFRYRVYRDTVSNFIYDTLKIIAVIPDTFFVDILGDEETPNQYFYKITAIDSAVNQSAASEEVQVTITGMPEMPPIVVEDIQASAELPKPIQSRHNNTLQTEITSLC